GPSEHLPCPGTLEVPGFAWRFLVGRELLVRATRLSAKPLGRSGLERRMGLSICTPLGPRTVSGLGGASLHSSQSGGAHCFDVCSLACHARRSMLGLATSHDPPALLTICCRACPANFVREAASAGRWQLHTFR